MIALAFPFSSLNFNYEFYSFHHLGVLGFWGFASILEGLVEFNQSWAKSATVLIVTVGSSKGYNGSVNTLAPYDLGQSVSYLVLQAQFLGLHTHQMGGIVSQTLKKNLEIPEDYEVYSVIAVGYLGKTEDLPEFLRDKEGAERTRKEISDFVFTGKWGSSFKTD